MSPVDLAKRLLPRVLAGESVAMPGEQHLLRTLADPRFKSAVLMPAKSVAGLALYRWMLAVGVLFARQQVTDNASSRP